MSALGIGMTDKDTVHGWEAIQPNHHPLDPIKIYALQAWKHVSNMVDQEADQDEIDRMIATAQELEQMARDHEECSCNPRTDCRLCTLVARVIYFERNGVR